MHAHHVSKQHAWKIKEILHQNPEVYNDMSHWVCMLTECLIILHGIVTNPKLSRQHQLEF